MGRSKTKGQKEKMKKKKVLFVVEAMGGGVFTYIVDLANELSNTYEMYIAYSTRRQTPENFKDYFNRDIHLIRVKNFTREINPQKDLAAFCELKRIASVVQPDIIHLHSSKAGALGRFAFDGRKLPVFYTPHGYSFLMTFNSSAKRKAYHLIEELCAKRKCTTISCSKGEHEETLKMTRRAAYVSNGINISQLQKMLDNVERVDHPFTVFTIGRINYQKNPDEFNEIAKRLPDVKFLWVGDGELRDRLTSPNIEITGWLDRKTALQKSLNGDVFILPSLWEGLPMSLLEAMYMKKPCIVSDVIGNRDVIHNGENGFVCNSTEEFVEAIHRAREGRKDLVEKAYQEVMNEYNTSVMAKKYSDIYALYSSQINGGGQN